MRSRPLVLLAVLPAALALFAACGDGPDNPSGGGVPTPIRTPVPNATPDGSPTRKPIPDDFGPAPALGGNVLKVSPAHAEKVKQAATRTANPQRPAGLCAEVTFEGLPENAQWFRIAFDDREVTSKLVWIVATQTNPRDGKVCYAPEEGFTVGKHSAAISVQDPRNALAASKQVVGWAFEVVP
ncbi:MAG: hypothetical protein C0506_02710 [Anaerolinea sp.]|nr:hypothetical protein [Anaerolinea sp.]